MDILSVKSAFFYFSLNVAAIKKYLGRGEYELAA